MSPKMSSSVVTSEAKLFSDVGHARIGFGIVVITRADKSLSMHLVCTIYSVRISCHPTSNERNEGISSKSKEEIVTQWPSK